MAKVGLFFIRISVTLGRKKDVIHPRTNLESPEGEQKYSSTIYLTSAVNEGRYLTPHPRKKDPLHIV
jgi:hypothetical protein